MTAFVGTFVGAFVGRQRERDLILRAASRAPTAGLVTVLLTGEAGIGKSTLLWSVGTTLADQRWWIWPVRADSLQRRIPYAAVAEALRTITGVDDGPAADLLSNARAMFDPLSTTSTQDSPDIWFGRTCEATTRLLAALSATGPVAVAIDDIDELDEDSLALLTVCLRRLASAPVAVLATRRTGPGPVLLIDRLADCAELTTIPLGPVPATDVGAIVEPVLGGTPDDSLAAEIHDRADGNPFFATELARSLVELELVTTDGGTARLAAQAETIRLTRQDALLHRVAPLEADTRTVAHALAVFRRVRLEQIGLLAQTSSLPLTTVAGALDDLLRRRIIDLVEDRVYRFTHTIVCETLYDEIGPAQRRQLHARIAAGMMADRERGLPTELLELAWHLAESAQPGDLAAAVVLTEAATEARSHAPERSAALCERALELLAAQSALRPGVESIRCRALVRASRPADAIAAGHAALAGLPAGPDRIHTATALVSSLFSTGQVAEAIEVVDAELRAGTAPVSLRASRALLLSFAGRTTEAVAEADLVERKAAEDGLPPTQRVPVFCQLTRLSSMLIRHERTAGYADRALAAAGSARTLQLQALAVGASTSALAGLVSDASSRLTRAEAIQRDTGLDGLYQGELLVTGLTLNWLRGQWDIALRGLAGVNAQLAAKAQVMLAGATQAIELAIRAWRGELDIAARLAELPAPGPRNMAGLYAVALADYLTVRGDPGAAEWVIEQALTDPAESSYGCVLLDRLIGLRLDAGRPQDAAASLDVLTEVATGRYAPWSRVCLYRATGLVHGDLDALRTAIAEADDAELVFERARTELALGLRTGDAGDELLRAYRTFAQLGAHGPRRATGHRLRELGVKVPRIRSTAHGLLSEAEQRIARLVRQGMRNREIAAALHYSTHSVEMYLSRIYAKLGVSSRLALARTLDTAERLG